MVLSAVFVLAYQVTTVFDDICLIGYGLFSVALDDDPFDGG